METITDNHRESKYRVLEPGWNGEIYKATSGPKAIVFLKWG